MDITDLSFICALVTEVLVSIATALLGVTLVLRRLSFIGDGLSHVAFGALAAATVCGFEDTPLVIALPIVAASSVLLLNSRSVAKIRGDAALAILTSVSLSAGYLLIHFHENLASHHSHEHMDAAEGHCPSHEIVETLLGSSSLADFTPSDIVLSVVLSVMVIAFFILFRKRIFAVSFDPEFSKVIGIRVSWWESALAVLSSIVILLAMKLVGALLVSALIVFPAVTAMKIAQSFAATLVVAAVVAAVTTATGFITAGVAGIPTGATIVAVSAVVFIVIALVRGNKS